MTHEIKNQFGNHIVEDDIRDEICFAIERDMTYTYYDEKRIDIVEHSVDHGGNKITVVEVRYEAE